MVYVLVSYRIHLVWWQFKAILPSIPQLHSVTGCAILIICIGIIRVNPAEDKISR